MEPAQVEFSSVQLGTNRSPLAELEFLEVSGLDGGGKVDVLC